MKKGIVVLEWWNHTGVIPFSSHREKACSDSLYFFVLTGLYWSIISMLYNAHILKCTVWRILTNIYPDLTIKQIKIQDISITQKASLWPCPRPHTFESSTYHNPPSHKRVSYRPHGCLCHSWSRPQCWQTHHSSKHLLSWHHWGPRETPLHISSFISSREKVTVSKCCDGLRAVPLQMSGAETASESWEDVSSRSA